MVSIAIEKGGGVRGIQPLSMSMFLKGQEGRTSLTQFVRLAPHTGAFFTPLVR